VAEAFAWLSKIAGMHLSWIASLLILPLAQEDLAIVLGGYAVVNHFMPVIPVVLSIYAGMIISDFALYGIGVGARYFPWLGDYAVNDSVRRFGHTLDRNLFGLVALCRLVPGLEFIAFVACGWARVPFSRFVVASFLVSALYLTIALYLVVVFGDAVDDHLGLWTWPLLLAVLLGAGLARKRIFSFADPPAQTARDSADCAISQRSGLLPLHGRERKLALAERIPEALLYFPLVLSWLGFAARHRSLTLPTAANPTMTTGGMWAESKSSYLFDVAAAERHWIADFVVVTRGGGATARRNLDRALGSLGDAGIEFPIIAKPDIGRQGLGVRRIDGAAALRNYLAGFPRGAKLILQRFVPTAGEAAIVYARHPGEPKGRILELAFRQIETESIGNPRAGSSYRDGAGNITPELEARLDAIACSMREFHYGRFDVRFESVEALMRGRGFSIVEINGIGAEAVEVWNPDLPIREVYRRLIWRQRLLFEIGEGNRARGFAPVPITDFVHQFMRQDWLIRQYHASA